MPIARFDLSVRGAVSGQDCSQTHGPSGADREKGPSIGGDWLKWSSVGILPASQRWADARSRLMASASVEGSASSPVLRCDGLARRKCQRAAGQQRRVKRPPPLSPYSVPDIETCRRRAATTPFFIATAAVSVVSTEDLGPVNEGGKDEWCAVTCLRAIRGAHSSSLGSLPMFYCIWPGFSFFGEQALSRILV